MDDKSSVFVTQETHHDFARAEEYGDIVFLTCDDLNNMAKSLHNEALITDIRRKLRDYNPDRDWIVVAGSPYVTAAVFLVLGQRGFRSLRLLRWDNRSFTYAPLYLNLGGQGS